MNYGAVIEGRNGEGVKTIMLTESSKKKLIAAVDREVERMRKRYKTVTVTFSK